MKKRVAIIIPGGIGGGYFLQGIPVLEDYIHRISESFDVTVYSMIKTEVVNQPQNYILRQVNAAYANHVFLKLFLLTLLFVRDHLKNKYQLMHGIWGFPSGFITVVLGKIFRIPTIVSLQGGEVVYIPEIEYGLLNSEIKRKLMSWTVKNTNTLTALTFFQMNELRKSGIKRSDFFIIPYGADNLVFNMPIRKHFNFPIRFIHIANVNEVKDQVTLLKTFKIIADQIDSSLQIIGNGPSFNKIKAFAGEINLEGKIEFTGAVAHKSLPEYLKNADIMLHTSLYEGQAVVIAEAAACGVVVCGTRVGLIADWGSELCISVDCRDAEMLAAQVLQLLESEEKFTTLRLNAYKWAVTNTAASTVDRFKELYTSLIK